MFKKVKRGQALIETIVVLSLYFFMLGFIISGFQLMYNKTVISIATYEYARTTIAYESAKKFNNSTTMSNSKMIKGNTDKFGVTNTGREQAQAIIENNALAVSMLHIDKYELFGLHSAEVSGTEKGNREAFDPAQHMYVQATITGSMDYLFPIIDPDLSGIIADSINFTSSYTLAKERVWTDKTFDTSEV